MILKRWVPFLALFLALLVTVFIWRELSRSQQAAFASQISIKSAAIKDDIKDNVAFRVRSLSRAVKRWEYNGKPDLRGWKMDARSLEGDPGYKYIVWAGPDKKAIVLAGLPDRSAEQAIDASFPELFRIKSPFVSGPVALEGARLGFIAYAPMYAGGSFMGVLAEVFDSQELIGDILSKSRHELGLYSISVTGDGVELYRSGPEPALEWAQRLPLKVFGSDWTLSVAPGQNLAASSISALPAIVLVMGALSSILFSSLIYSAQSASLRGRGRETANAMLRAEIEERAWAEGERARSEDKFRALVETSYDLVWETDENAVYTYVSPRVKQMLGYEQHEVLGRPFWDFMLPDEAERVREEFARVSAARQPLSLLENVNLSKDGRCIVLETSGAPVFDSKGAFLGYRGIDRDVTGKKLAEEALRRSEASLANAQRIARIGSWDWDIEKDELIWSDEAYRIFGLDPSGFGATYEAFLGCVHPEDRPMVHKCVTESLTLKKPYSIEHRLVLPDGTEKYVHEHGEVAFRREGRPVRMSGTIQDITERKTTEEQLKLYREHLKELVDERTAELKQLNRKLAFEVDIRKQAEDAVSSMNDALEKRAAELERVNKELEAFTYSASHDLQEPLRVISGYVQLLSRRYKGRLDSEADEFIGFAVDGVARMQRLIADLLRYSRVGKIMAQQPVDCSAALGRAMSNLGALLSESGAVVRADGLPTIMADESQIDQLFMNLLSNAVKYRGDNQPLITIAVERLGRQWRFSITDNGIGIDPKYSERIFELFQRLHGNTGLPGTGLGLSICKKVVENHGGRIWVESMPGAGSTFYFTMPGEEAASA
ncbi:MAG TPA: hypothetical protein DDW94_08945 [Deltaproteobacteria bacterium]|nr:MAG: hypothetical protein A2Z79_03450 [Deltaproteobacteria bacterium GWA2_55_82]OGQ62332.1 MAG: hypothetical protein A3I81_05360 [Deltaproteobacteria bacterium RIFCSPLOWO2_02_FULL_55_12]OIJ74445.1 MAG: hypothetical protein A2V21_309350 [Deltaproteobacteria bacterium GWC2_55_46]HBG47099.1 hypothetical protein [Deltaproteobacteria bacterium]HCY10841.1 hypothetical protein [Deltaproteobacteria bacterium]